jgi:hypothetical protein
MKPHSSSQSLTLAYAFEQFLEVSLFARRTRESYAEDLASLLAECGQMSTETKGTVFHGCHHSQQTVLDGLAMLADRTSLAAIHRIKEVKGCHLDFCLTICCIDAHKISSGKPALLYLHVRAIFE